MVSCRPCRQGMIAAGEVGEPVSAVLQSRDPAAPPFEYVKGGGGLFKDMGKRPADWRADTVRRQQFFDAEGPGVLRYRDCLQSVLKCCTTVSLKHGNRTVPL